MTKKEIIKLFKENKLEDIAHNLGRMKLSLIYNELYNLPGFIGFSGSALDVARCVKQALGE